MRASLGARAAVHAALGDPMRLGIVESLLVCDRTPSEVAARTGAPSNLLAHHLGILRSAGIVTETVSSGDRRRRYLQINPAALHGLELRGPKAPENVLFVCSQNSARSQIAAALFKRVAGRQADSAGTHPSPSVHPLAIETAQAHGLDTADWRPRPLDLTGPPPGLVVTVCDQANEELRQGGPEHIHWSVPDPATKGTRQAFEAAYRMLERRVAGLVA